MLAVSNRGARRLKEMEILAVSNRGAQRLKEMEMLKKEPHFV